MKRREFITLLSSAAGAVAWPLAARTEPFELPIVGFLHAGNERPRAVASFQKGLAEGGYVTDRNVAFDFRWADEQFDRLPALATGLVRRNVAVIAAFGNAAARAAQAATTTIPITFASSSAFIRPSRSGKCRWNPMPPDSSPPITISRSSM